MEENLSLHGLTSRNNEAYDLFFLLEFAILPELSLTCPGPRIHRIFTHGFPKIHGYQHG